ncbi:DUF5131 family protein [Actinoplanes sp. NPDC051494]|uniref:DUF5131 family protein n=1 Tax=Actinoplanes sp. NPDC051494 TaxID=3363907 RepID=UPI00379FBB7C
MSTSSSIEWTEKTWNPTTGCDRISAGCDHCYALTMAKRLKGMGSAKYQTDGDPRTSGPGFGVANHPDALTEPLSWRKPTTVFVNSMSDLFHAGIPRDFMARVFGVMAATTQHTYQVLTKRPERMARMLNDAAWRSSVFVRESVTRGAEDRPLPTWPLTNVWLGTSIESDEHVNRADALRNTPAAVRFIFAKPLLGPLPSLDLTDIDWLIAGGESGAGARPMELSWVGDLIDRCREAGTAPFVKLLCTKLVGSASLSDLGGVPRHRRQPQLPSNDDQELLFSRPQFLKSVRWKFRFGQRCPCGCDLSSSCDDSDDGTYRFGQFRHEADCREPSFEPLLVGSADLVEERHEFAQLSRMRNCSDVRRRLKSEGNVLAVRGQKFVVGGQPNVAPLSRVVTRPEPILIAKRQVTAEQHPKQCHCRRDRAVHQRHLGPPSVAASVRLRRSFRCGTVGASARAVERVPSTARSSAVWRRIRFVVALPRMFGPTAASTTEHRRDVAGRARRKEIGFRRPNDSIIHYAVRAYDREKYGTEALALPDWLVDLIYAASTAAKEIACDHAHPDWENGDDDPEVGPTADDYASRYVRCSWSALVHAIPGRTKTLTEQALALRVTPTCPNPVCVKCEHSGDDHSVSPFFSADVDGKKCGCAIFTWPVQHASASAPEADDRQRCSRCGDDVYTLSTDDLCDGCVHEDVQGGGADV